MSAPIHDMERVQVVQRAEELGRIEPAALFVEAALVLEVVEELAAVDVREYEIELLRALEGELEWDDERRCDLCEDGALRERVRDLGP